ncbi:MAG: hypothetical protein IJG80_00240 [Selenomonadaceae bacterium]|nr:hypothetical protein [Selenomonadaceae bacterium]
MANFKFISFTGGSGSYGLLPLDVLPGATTFTIEVKFSTTETASYSNNYNWKTIIGREIQNYWQDDFGLCVNGGKLCFWAEPKSSGSSSTCNTPSNAVVNDGKMHTAAVVSSNGAIDLYCDGNLVAHTDNVNAKITNAQKIYIAYNSDSASYLAMDLYEARFWSVARSQAEIFANIEGDEEGLEAWYIPNGSETLSDSSVNGRDATLYGSPAYTETNELPMEFSFDVERVLVNESWTPLKNLVAYLPFDSSTTEDLFGNTWTAYGSPTIKDGELYLPSGAYLRAENIIDLNADKWTFSAWCYRVSSSGDEGFFGFGEGISRRGIIAGHDGVYIASSGGGSWQKTNSSLLFPSVTGQWKHLAIVKDGTSLKFFEGGSLVWDATIAGLNDTGVFLLGGNSYGYTNDLYFDEVCFYEGAALWSENFTPPTAEDYIQTKLGLNAGAYVGDSVNTSRRTVNAAWSPKPYLKVWLPFDKTPTQDLCGNEWTLQGSPTISETNAINGRALQVTGDISGVGIARLRLENIELGGQSFTIKGWFTRKAGISDTWAAVALCQSYGGLLNLPLNDQRTIFLGLDAGENLQARCLAEIKTGEYIKLNQTYSFEYTYCHGLSKAFVFLDGQITLSFDVTIPRTTFAYCWIDFAHFNAGRLQATLDEFRIYDGCALHEDEFAPLTKENYIPETLALEKQATFSLDAALERDCSYTFDYTANIECRINNAARTVITNKFFNLPAMREVWMEFDIFFDGVSCWRAGNDGSNGLCSVGSLVDNSMEFKANGSVVQTVGDACAQKVFRTVLLHMLSDTTAGVIEAWSNGVKVYTYTGDVNHGALFENLFIYSEGEGTYFTDISISNSDLVGRRLVNTDVNLERRLKNDAYVWTTPEYAPITGYGSVGGYYSRTGYAFYQTQIVKCFDLAPTYDLWLDFDVYFDGEHLWRAGNAGANGICGIIGSADLSVKYLSNGELVHSVAEACAVGEVQPILLHMTSNISGGVIEAWVNGTKIYTYTGDVNHGEDFNNVFLQCDGEKTVFSNVTVSNVELLPRHYDPVQTIHFCMRHGEKILRCPLIDVPIRPALVVRHDNSNWYNELVAPSDSRASAVRFFCGGNEYALSLSVT